MLAILLLTLSPLISGDSLRTETINGKLFVVHQVGEKETLYSLSRRYGTTVAEILVQNPTADAGLEVGQILKIPYGGKPKAPAAVQTSDGIIHKVAPKETLFSIARQYNVSVDDIVAWNNLKETSLNTGQEILIRKKSPAETTMVKPVATAATAATTHTVAPKETLYSIAKLYGMSVQQLMEWNSLTANDLKVGQVLSVAAPATTAQTAPVTTTPTTTVAKPPTTSVTVTPVITPASTTKPATVVISESISGMDEVHESGQAALIEGTEGNRKYLGQHRTIKPGTILKIRNLSNNQEVFIRITGPPTIADEATIIWISKSAYDRLGATDKFRAEITYYK